MFCLTKYFVASTMNVEIQKANRQNQNQS